ncbi:matrixin family metalloprotease [Candidatus Woesearchaeota archaeon]|nr:matrixin family metalloprotease [Candidatus Woesearchaeota archaeon]
MRKAALVFISVILFVLGSILAISKPDTGRVAATVSPSGRAVVIPAHAVQVAPGVFDLGTTTVNGQALQGYMYIDYKDEASHNPNHAKTQKSTCYAFLSQGARWKETEPYVLDTSNSHNMSDAFVDSVTAVSLNTWDEQAAFEIFGDRDAGNVVDGADTSAPDNKNEIFFGTIAEPGAIAVTTVWGIFSGPPQQRKLVEFDVVFDDVDFVWGDALANPLVMDYQNIAAHEFGHAAGMGHTSDSCTEETMYRFASAGETKKRDLNAGDIEGIKKLYK